MATTLYGSDALAFAREHELEQLELREGWPRGPYRLVSYREAFAAYERWSSAGDDLDEGLVRLDLED